MSWEVSTMPSKRSCFNRTLYRKNLSRFWPLWGGVSLVGAMVPLYLLLALIRHGAHETDIGAFREGLYQASAYFVPGFTCAYAILCVMLVWGYLYNARAVGLMHTLPADRTCLFVTNTLSVLSMALIPFAVTGGLLCLIALGWGFFDLTAVAVAVLSVLCCTTLFTGMATLCAMLTGHIFVLPVFYLLANFLAWIMEMLVTNLAHEFLIGVPMLEDTGRLSFLSPVIQIYNGVRVYYEPLPDGTLGEYRITGLQFPVLYALAGLAMLALAWFLYKRRHSESAGDVVAFRWLRPVFRYGVALLSALTIGRLLYALLWNPLFQRGYYADVLPMGACLFLGGLIGYYAASMLLEKSLRVFGRKSLPGVGIVAAGAVVLCLLVSVDVFGLERKIPAWEDIESVSLSDRGIYSGPFDTEKDPDQAAALRAFHQAIVADRGRIRSYVPDWDREEGKAFSHYLYLNYYLKDGSVLTREYDLWLTEERVAEAGTYDNLLAEFYKDPVVIAQDVRIPEGAELDGIDVCCDYTESYYVNTTDHADGGRRETRQIYDALQQDAREGNIPAKDILGYYHNWVPRSFYLQINYFSSPRGNGVRYSSSKTVYLTPSMTHTIDALVELGYVTRTELAQWERDLADMGSEREGTVRAEQSMVLPEERMVYAG